ncbi:MAG: hypothetical protein V4710_07310 [Verrucomicrobiota bacterium]
MKPAEITSEFYKALARPNGWQSIRDFYSKLHYLEKSDIEEGLLATFDHRSFTAHNVGCAILWCLRVPFTRELTSGLAQLLINWDLSTEELPFYLSDACGRTNLNHAVEKLLGSVEAGSDTARKLNTIQFWLSADDLAINDHRMSWLRKLAVG